MAQDLAYSAPHSIVLAVDATEETTTEETTSPEQEQPVVGGAHDHRDTSHEELQETALNAGPHEHQMRHNPSRYLHHGYELKLNQ